MFQSVNVELHAPERVVRQQEEDDDDCCCGCFAWLFAILRFFGFCQKPPKPLQERQIDVVIDRTPPKETEDTTAKRDVPVSPSRTVLPSGGQIISGEDSEEPDTSSFILLTVSTGHREEDDFREEVVLPPLVQDQVEEEPRVDVLHKPPVQKESHLCACT